MFVTVANSGSRFTTGAAPSHARENPHTSIVANRLALLWRHNMRAWRRLLADLHWLARQVAQASQVQVAPLQVDSHVRGCRRERGNEARRRVL